MGLDEIRRLKEQAAIPKQPKQYSIPKVSKKKQAALDTAKESGTDSGIDKFFLSLRSKMKGRCLFCGGTTMKEDDEKFHFSLAHILPKAIFKSVAQNEDNIIELCFWGNSCHTNLDNGKITWEFVKDSKEWEVIYEKLLNLLPLVSPEERKHKLYSKFETLVYGK